MTTPTRIRAQIKEGNIADVRVLMTHPMHTGTRKDANGTLVPAEFINKVEATLNGRMVLSAKWGVAVSQDPFLWFRVQNAKVGDKLAVSWFDNLGKTRTDEAVLA